MLARFASKERPPAEPLLAGNAMSSERPGHSGDKFSLTVAQRGALNHYLTQQSGGILAINGLPGIGEITLVLFIIATEWAKATLDETEPPMMAATSTNSQTVTSIIEAFGKDFSIGTGSMAGC